MRMGEEGFQVLPGKHPICPVMFGDAVVATKIADAMLGHGVYVIAFSFPVVPRDAARIRVQISASHTESDIDACVRAFVAARTSVLG
jgi:glycine C-acetyltransferase